jgi:hypothetical protein
MKKTNDYYGTLYAGIAMNVKTSTIMGPIWGIVMNVKNQRLLWDPMCRYCNECKKLMIIMGPICGYCNEYKKPTTIMGPICGYYIFENGFMEVIIENDVGIICLKCVYVLKVFR